MNTPCRHLVFALLLFVLAAPVASVHAADSDAQLAVLVTGASSGIGRKITASGFRRMSEKKYAKEGSPFAEDFQEMLARETDRSKYKEPDEVAEAVAHALFADAPKRRYLVVPNAQEAEWTIGQVITELVQLNQDQPYEYTRDELIEMLDQAMATTESNP